MNSWFNKLTGALNSETISQNDYALNKIPEQFYCKNFVDFNENLNKYIQKTTTISPKLCVFTDGVPKNAGNGLSADVTLSNLLTELKYQTTWYNISELLNIPPHDLHASHAHLETLTNLVKKHPDNIFVVLGSGTITDLIKHSLFLENSAANYISIPTALTVTAFTSAFSVIDWHGAKKTKISRAINANFWIEPILNNAPISMTKAGYGDLLARFLAYGDWYLSYEIGLAEQYNEIAFRLMEPFAEGLKLVSEQLSKPQLKGDTVECIAAALSMAGIAMTASRETSPLSGYEHVISHALDFLHNISDEPYVLHGEQVALGCMMSARSFEWILSKPTLKFKKLSGDKFANSLDITNLEQTFNDAPFKFCKTEADKTAQKKQQIQSALLEFSGEYANKSKKIAAAQAKLEEFVSRWPQIKEKLKTLIISAAEMESLLQKATLPTEPEHTNPPTSTEQLNWAIKFSPFIRARASLSDIIYWMDENPISIAKAK